MRLLFILPEYLPHPGGGIATFYQNLLPFCVSQGHQVRVILGSTHTQGDAQYELDGVVIEQLKPALYRQYCTRFRRFSVFPELQGYLAAAWAAHEQAGRGEGYDLIEVADWGMAYVPWIVSEPVAPVQVQLH